MWACDNDMYGDYLAHYGVVGMRWGIRRYQPYSYTGARKDGKLGKEVGAAARLAKRAAKAAGKGAVKAGKVAGKGAVVAGKAVGKGAVVAGKGAVKAGKAAYAAKKSHDEKVLNKRKRMLIDYGTPDEIRAARGKILSEKDISDAIARIRNDDTLKDMKDKANKKRIERGKEAVKMAVELGTSLLSLYGLAESIEKKVNEHTKRLSAEENRKYEMAARTGAKQVLLDNADKIPDDYWERYTKRIQNRNKVANGGSDK